jgi:hypothetical protein
MVIRLLATLVMVLSINKRYYKILSICQVRDELEQLLDDDDDMADLYLSRKLAGASSPVSGSGGPNWFPASPTIGSKISRASRASAATVHGNENDVEELEMLLEVIYMLLLCLKAITISCHHLWSMYLNLKLQFTGIFHAN